MFRAMSPATSNNTEAAPRSAPFAEGFGAGLCLTIADLMATGPWRTPGPIVLWMLAFGVCVGLVAGCLSKLAPPPLRARGGAAALAFGAWFGLHSLSLVSKHLSLGPLLLAGCLAAALAIGLATGATLRRCQGARALAWMLLIASGIAAGSLLFLRLGSSRTALVAALLLPALVAGGGALLANRVPSRMLQLLTLAASCCLPLPVLLLDHEPPRRFPPSHQETAAPEGAPNVVLVIVDTLRADLFGDDEEAQRSPFLQSFAADGARFENVISGASWTLPAVSTLLTSLYPSQHGADTKEHSLPGDVQTLAESFHAAGWETVAFSGGAFVSPAFGLDQGFEYFDHLAEFSFRPFRFHVPLAWRAAKNRYLPQRWLLEYVQEFGGMPELRKRANDWLALRDSSRPFFLLVHSYQVHDYYIYDASTDAEVLAQGLEFSAQFQGRLSVPPSELTSAAQSDLDSFRALYEARLTHVDTELRHLFQGLEQHSAARPLHALFTSDHGEGWDAGAKRVHHGRRLHDDLLKVPLFLRAPGRVPAGAHIETQVRSVDVMPTLLDLAGIEAPASAEGRSLLQFFSSEVQPGDWPENAWSEEHGHGARALSLRTQAWKLIGGEPGNEAYHIGRDPLETRNSIQQVPDNLRQIYSGFQQQYPPHSGEDSVIDGATMDHLRALGYIE